MNARPTIGHWDLVIGHLLVIGIWTLGFSRKDIMAKKRVVTTTLNGNQTEFLCEPRQTLLEVLRDTLDLTGTKEGCSNGNCGACTVLFNGRPVDSCLVLAVEADGAKIETIEGIATGDGLDPIQRRFSNGGVAVRHLHAGLHHVEQSAAVGEPEADRGRNPLLSRRQFVSLHRLRQNRPSRPRGRHAIARPLNDALPRIGLSLICIEGKNGSTAFL